jgi:phenylalanyl-tRNA synthetase beta chain
MKFALSTLKEFLETQASLDEICKTLTKIGLEVENCEDKAKNLADFSVAKIIEAKPHENSNKLKICLVETSDSKVPLQIICGASNARQGIKVAYAPINSTIPSNGMIIKKAKIAGVESNGMLCSARELSLGNEDAGIIEIDEKFAIGTKISEVFGINDAIIEINITPNRGDCLGVLGIACDLSATKIGILKTPKITKIAGNFKFDLAVSNQNPQACPAISFRVLKNIKNCQSPAWLVKKIESAGMNSISAVVDVTNYVMHILNRPMHAYDLNKIGKKITIGNASPHQKFLSLKNSEHQLDEKILTISDENNVLSVAGVMGSKHSSCEIETSSILLESAFFSKENVAISGRSLNILSDSRHRFERGVDYQTCIDGIELATQLILEICGGEASEIFIENHNLPQQFIDFDFTKFESLIGIKIAEDKAMEILNSLGFKTDKNFRVEVPSKRHDIFSSEDLVEEILRIYGYENIQKNILENSANNFQNFVNPLHKARILLASKGLTETISWSFVDEKIVEIFAEKKANLILQNPISLELNHMRPTLAIGLINSYQKNYLRNFQNLALFEIGNIFISPTLEQTMISGLRAGKNKEQNHYHDERDVDFFDVKKDFFDVIEHFGIKPESLQITGDSPLKYYHPHRFACAKLGKNIIGYFGEIHPAINKFFDIKTRLYIFEIFVDSLPALAKSNSRKAYQTNDFPIVERDFAFVVDKNLMVGELTKSIQTIDKNLIKEVNIFDIFSGNNIEEGKKSVALRVKIQSSEKTFTSAEIDDLSAKIIETLANKFEAKLRF